MSNPPPVIEVASRIDEALENMGNEKSLGLLGRLGAETPNWLKIHLEMQHTYPSPSNITRCRYQLWLNANEKPRDEDPPSLWKIRQLMGIISEPLWLAVLGMAGFEIALPNKRFTCGVKILCEHCKKLGLSQSNDRQIKLLKQLDVSPPVSLFDTRSIMPEDAVSLEGEVVWWRKIGIDSIAAELLLRDDFGKFSEKSVDENLLDLTHGATTKWPVDEAVALGKLQRGMINSANTMGTALVGGRIPTLMSSAEASPGTLGNPRNLSSSKLFANFSTMGKRERAMWSSFTFVPRDTSLPSFLKLLSDFRLIETARNISSMLRGELSSSQSKADSFTLSSDSGIALGEALIPRHAFLCSHGTINYTIMWAHPDAVLDNEYLVELKTLNGWGYKGLLESSVGVSAEEDGHYTQAQLYLYAADKEWCLYLATPPDPGFLQSTMRQKKRYGPSYEMPPVYLEWIERDDATIEDALQRAEMIVEDSKSDEPPPREFDGRTHNPKGKRLMPCGFCLFSGTCQTKYGYGDYAEGVEWV